MPLYEHVVIARQEISQTQVDQIIAQFKGIISEQDGTVGRTEYWGLKTLTYRIRKNRKGHYILMDIDAPPAALAELERQERIHDDVLRYLTVRVEEHEQGASAMLQNRNRDDRRDDRRGDRDRGPRGDRDGGRDRDRDRGDRDRDRGPRGDRGDRPPRESRA
ncbi:MAG: 30S ribosomal protein S6, partial [Alphaproteobacteria bacterium]|nr:30S ribosomal protein S6 [Alphaproteobacteria bacterium]